MSARSDSYKGSPIVRVTFVLAGREYPLDGRDGYGNERRPLAQDVFYHLQWEMFAAGSYSGSITFLDIPGYLEDVYYNESGGKAAIRIDVYWSEDANNKWRHVALYGVIFDLQYDINNDGTMLTMFFSAGASSHDASVSDVDVQEAFSYSASKMWKPHEVFLEFARIYKWRTSQAGASTVFEDPSAPPVPFNLSYDPRVSVGDRRVLPSQYFAELCSTTRSHFVTSATTGKRAYQYRNEPAVDGSGIVHFFHPVGWDPVNQWDRIALVSEYQFRAGMGDVLSASIDASFLTAAYISGASAKFVHRNSRTGSVRTAYFDEYLVDMLPREQPVRPSKGGAPETEITVSANTDTEADAIIAGKVRSIRSSEFAITLTVIGDPLIRPNSAFRYRHFLPDGREHFVSGIYRAEQVQNSVDAGGWATTITAVRLGLPDGKGGIAKGTATAASGDLVRDVIPPKGSDEAGNATHGKKVNK